MYQNSGPMQAMAVQGATTKSVISDYSPYGTHGGWGGSPYSPHQNIPSQGRFNDRERLPMSDVAGHGKQLPSAEREQQLRMELQQVDHQISQQTQMRGLEESQPSLDIKNKLGTTKQTENGQLEPQSKVAAEDLALTFSSDVPNGSALTQENIGLLSNKTASLSLSEDPERGGDNHDSQRAGVAPTSAP
ncbi:PREDICTED: roquin-1-like [Buceros rhinoceros silvestris]|uniref:roquin-1-like n=1 Tax=Buceros rhinoceros silvestris TaxID=175836 RepID=UPI0005285145|nr:PREDICTED: roquin-1-like [Buceros rhinoceros silvestris]